MEANGIRCRKGCWARIEEDFVFWELERDFDDPVLQGKGGAWFAKEFPEAMQVAGQAEESVLDWTACPDCGGSLEELVEGAWVPQKLTLPLGMQRA